LIPAIG